MEETTKAPVAPLEPDAIGTLTPVAAAGAHPAMDPANAPIMSEPSPDQGLTTEITYDDFAKVQLRVGHVTSAERIEKSEKLLKLQVDLGEERGPRQILAGIAKIYAPEEMVGRKIVVVANLKPVKLMGQLSEGMLLAASDDAGNLELVSPGSIVAGGVVR